MRELKVIFRALADISRLEIVHHLSSCGDVTVTDLAGLERMSQPLISWHLRILRRAGLVHTKRVGRTVYCSLNRDQLLWAQAELSRLAQGLPVREDHYSLGRFVSDNPVEA